MPAPRESELPERELVRRLAQFCEEVTAVDNAAVRPVLERLVTRAAELGLADGNVGEQLMHLRAYIDAIDLKVSLSRGELPSIPPPDSAAGAVCHFLCPVRFGRRRADQCGHLLLSATWLQFRGALDVSVAWSEVESVRRDHQQILVTLRDSTRVLRFSCHSHAEAARGAVIAEHLARRARAEPVAGAREYHASA